MAFFCVYVLSFFELDLLCLSFVCYYLLLIAIAANGDIERIELKLLQTNIYTAHTHARTFHMETYYI